MIDEFLKPAAKALPASALDRVFKKRRHFLQLFRNFLVTWLQFSGCTPSGIFCQILSSTYVFVIPVILGRCMP
jgi:hypothetical protein